MVDKVTCAKCTWAGGYEKCSRLLSSLDLESSRHLPILVSLRGPYGGLLKPLANRNNLFSLIQVMVNVFGFLSERLFNTLLVSFRTPKDSMLSTYGLCYGRYNVTVLTLVVF